MKSGKLTVISGPMFAEKSGTLINRVAKIKTYQNKKAVAFKPSLDTRFHATKIVSRIGTELESYPISARLDDATIQHLFAVTNDCDLVAIDESQFFSRELLQVVRTLLGQNKDLVVAGLNLNYLGEAFGCMGDLVLMADEHQALTAYCSCCGAEARYTQRLINGQPAPVGDEVVVGDKEDYEPRCRTCFVSPYDVPESIDGA